VIRNRLRRPSERTIAGSAAALAALVVGIIQFRHGIVHLLDTVSYWSGAQAVADGHPFTSRLAPSFSNFDAIEFVQRGGRVPFVDFPLGYPLSAGIIGAVIGVRRAMQLMCVLSLAAIAAAAVAGTDTKRGRTIGAAIFGTLVVMLPITRTVTQGALSEPLFTAVALWFVIALARFRGGGSFRPVAILGASLGLLRFIGGPLIVMAAWEHHRRHRDLRRTALVSLGMVAPTALNAMWAAAAGGGHSAGWRGIGGDDITFLVRSIGGWFDSRQGDIRRTYFTLDGTSWWAWVVGAVWVIAAVYALACMIRGRSSRLRLTAPAEFALVASGVITAGLLFGMLGFDALVAPDNRLMMPAGVLALFALTWTVIDRLEVAPNLRFPLFDIAALVLLALWAIFAVRPLDITERFSDESGERPYVQDARDLDVTVIVTDDADAMLWDTGISAVYFPQATKVLTGEPVDEAAIYDALPCVLLENDGAMILSRDAFFPVNREYIDAEVSKGTLALRDTSSASIYLPTERACD
jgi:hypothetical protein